jgi:hypothetical protein
VTTESPILQFVEHRSYCTEPMDDCETCSGLREAALDEEITDAFDNDGRPELPVSLFPDAFEFWGEPELGEAGC